MTSPRDWFHLATIRQGELEKAFAVGGKDRSATLNTVEELEEESATWRKADSFLEEGRGQPGSVVVPKEFICPA